MASLHQLRLPPAVNLFSRRCHGRRDSTVASTNGVPFSKPKSGPMIIEIPLDKIRRPLMRTRANDPEKVKDLMESIREIGLQEPIDVLEVEGAYYGTQTV